MRTKKKMDYRFPHYTEDDLRTLDHEALVWAYCLLQDRFEHLRDYDLPNLEEKYRIRLVKQFGRSTEKSSALTRRQRRKRRTMLRRKRTKFRKSILSGMPDAPTK